LAIKRRWRGSLNIILALVESSDHLIGPPMEPKLRNRLFYFSYRTGAKATAGYIFTIGIKVYKAK
jgi:hypothetical protein